MTTTKSGKKNDVEILSSVDGTWRGSARSKTAVNQKRHSPYLGVRQPAIVQQSGFS
jgi:hypothetical protein